MPEAPSSVVEDIKSLRETFRLKWNPHSKVIQTGGYDAEGNLVPPVHDGRWELWDTDPDGADYRVMTLQEPNGDFRPVDQRLVEYLRLIDPARYGGDVSKMARALIDEPNQKILDDISADADDVVEMAAKWYSYALAPKARVLSNIK